MSKYVSLFECVSGYQDDTTAYYEAVRQFAGNNGIVWDQDLKAWIVTSYQGCASLLQSSHLAANRLSLPREGAPDLIECAENILKSQMMFSDSVVSADRHQQWTTLLQGGRGESADDDLTALARDSISNSLHENEIELYGTTLRPFASRVVCSRLSLAEDEREGLYPYISQYVRFLDGKIRTEKEFQTAMFSIVTLYDRLGRKWNHSNTFEGYERHDWIADYILALVAGHDSTAYLLGTIFVNIDPGCLPDGNASNFFRMASESLRYDSPVQLIGRRAQTSFSLKGQTIQEGDRVFLHIGAANRDPSVYQAPDEFLIERSGLAPLSFGGSASKCVGRSLVIRSAVAFLNVLYQRNEWFEVFADRAQGDSGIAGRGFRNLPGKRISLSAA